MFVQFILLLLLSFNQAFAKTRKLSEAELSQALPHVEAVGWKLTETGDAIEKIFTFSDFNEAFGFMTRCALKAESINHHPEWSNVYNRVAVTLTTHEFGGLSNLDLNMAVFMVEIAG
ncbi:Pterin-4-alpha-carbinolamine dehydratase [Holothuria leucospilota]|uniref:4a-hydroxytetrahydrobiopterin dehydratase n=1 Tax=Holothuria leucospilota TaxID=206669 RepID=A0A9Q1H448_HOLLE|nr:Pterin-4-alpha-carbinolamine dehydratase [Holothuria leucospilota]